MLQACQLRDFLSFGELLERVEGLEKRLAGTLPAGRPPEVPGLSEPPGDWRTNGAAEPSQSGKALSGNSDWQGFLTFLAGRNRPMSKVLEEWKFLNLSADVLQLSRGARSFSAAYFDDPEKRDQLRAYCREFFGRDLRIDLLEDPNSSSPKKRITPAKSRKADKAPKKTFPPPVQDIIDVFQGEVTSEGPPKKPVSG